MHPMSNHISNTNNYSIYNHQYYQHMKKSICSEYDNKYKEKKKPRHLKQNTAEITFMKSFKDFLYKRRRNKSAGIGNIATMTTNESCDNVENMHDLYRKGTNESGNSIRLNLQDQKIPWSPFLRLRYKEAKTLQLQSLSMETEQTIPTLAQETKPYPENSPANYNIMIRENASPSNNNIKLNRLDHGIDTQSTLDRNTRNFPVQSSSSPSCLRNNIQHKISENLELIATELNKLKDSIIIQHHQKPLLYDNDSSNRSSSNSSNSIDGNRTINMSKDYVKSMKMRLKTVYQLVNGLIIEHEKEFDKLYEMVRRNKSNENNRRELLIRNDIQNENDHDAMNKMALINSNTSNKLEVTKKDSKLKPKKYNHRLRESRNSNSLKQDNLVYESNSHQVQQDYYHDHHQTILNLEIANNNLRNELDVQNEVIQELKDKYARDIEMLKNEFRDITSRNRTTEILENENLQLRQRIKVIEHEHQLSIDNIKILLDNKEKYYYDQKHKYHSIIKGLKNNLKCMAMKIQQYQKFDEHITLNKDNDHILDSSPWFVSSRSGLYDQQYYHNNTRHDLQYQPNYMFNEDF